MNDDIANKVLPGLISTYTASTAVSIGLIFLMPNIVGPNTDMGPYTVAIVAMTTIAATIFAVHKVTKNIKYYAIADLFITAAYAIVFAIPSDGLAYTMVMPPLAILIYLLHIGVQAMFIRAAQSSKRS